MSNVQNTGQVTYSKARIRLMLFALVFCVFIQGFGNFKLIPMQEAIQTFFQIEPGAYGIMGSAQNWMMIVLSIPLAYVARKMPCKWSYSIGFCVSVLGMVIQIFATSFPLFVIGRMLEGGGFGFVHLTSGSLFLTLVPANRRAFWASVSVVASVLPQVIISRLGSKLLVDTGMSFQQLFMIICGMYVVAIIIWLICVPVTVHVHGVADSTKPTREQTMRVYKNTSNWLIGIAFIFYNAVSVGFTSYVVKFISTKGMSLTDAAAKYSYTTLIGMVAMLAFGVIADKLGTKRKIVMIGYFVCAVALISLSVLPANLIFIYIVLYGTFPRSIVGLTNAASSDIVEVPSDIPIANSVRNMITQIGNVIMTIAMGYLIQFAGYSITIYILAGGCLIGAVLWFFAKKIP